MACTVGELHRLHPDNPSDVRHRRCSLRAATRYPQRCALAWGERSLEHGVTTRATVPGLNAHTDLDVTQRPITQIDQLHLVALVEHEPFTRHQEIRTAEVDPRDRDR
jgi:hypothetical protein